MSRTLSIIENLNIEQLANQYGINGNVYFVMKSTESYYSNFLKRWAKKYFDGTQSVYNTITAALAACTSGRGDIVVVSPGFYVEAAGIEWSQEDVKLVALNKAPEATVLFGTAVTGTVGAATKDLLNISAGKFTIDGLGLFTYKDTKSAIVCDGEGGGYYGSMGIIQNCEFSPQAVDGQAYGIDIQGASNLLIKNNRFFATKTAGILIEDDNAPANYSVNCTISENQFVGTGDAGIKVVNPCYQLLIDSNIFQPGSYTGYNMTKGIVTTSGMTAGDITYSRNVFNLAAADVISDGSSGTTINDKAKLGNTYLA